MPPAYLIIIAVHTVLCRDVSLFGHPCLRYSPLPMSPGRTSSEMASRKGFEPLTYGLGNRCSILLSYRDAFIGCAGWLFSISTRDSKLVETPW